MARAVVAAAAKAAAVVATASVLQAAVEMAAPLAAAAQAALPLQCRTVTPRWAAYRLKRRRANAQEVSRRR